ncbi:MAG: T9SS type A sorting domain-containing protein [Chitinophagales bacterium]
MKKSLLTLLFFSLCAITASVYVMKIKQLSISEAKESNLLRASIQNFEEKTHSFIGAYEYIRQMKANLKTGHIEAADLVKAQQAADKLAKNRTKKADQIHWKFLGPTSVGGRTRAILVDKDNSQRMIIGGVSGGIFTSNDGGLNWTDHPQNTEFLSLSISAIAQAPNGDIYVGTGENFDGRSYGEGKLGNSVLPGTGVYKSTDRGNSFQLLASTIPNLNNGSSNIYNRDWAAIQDIEVHPNNSNWVYVATSRSLQISQDGGETWSKANGIPTTSVAYDIAVAEDGTAHAVVGSRYYQAIDGLNFTGEFTGTSLGQFEISSGNKVLAMSPSDNDYLYIVTVKSNGCLRKVWQSKDGGEIWIIIGEGDNTFFNPMRNGNSCQGWYDLCVTVDPANKERIFLGGVTLWSWSPEDSWNQLDGGASPYDVHPDKHTLVFDPNNSNTLYIGSDGGITRSLNAQNLYPTFEAINQNYFATQFYGIAANIEGNVIGGTQDNGTVFVAPDGSSIYDGGQPYITGGDGGFCDISKLKPLATFVSSVNGGIKRSGSAKPPFSSFFDYNADCAPTNPEGSCNPDGHLDGNPLYITPFILWEDVFANAIDPSVQKTKFITGACDGRVWMTEGALDFTAIPSWKQIGKFVASRCISALTVSYDGTTVYAGTADGRMMCISNLDSDNPSTKEFLIEGAIGQYISSIDVDYNNGHIVVGLGNYGRDQNIVKSFNANSVIPTFSSIQHNLPLMPVYTVAQNKFNVSPLVVGTELGIWMYDENTQTWTEENGSMGRVPVHSLRFQQVKAAHCGVLYAGTHGRGIYRSTDFLLPDCEDIFPGDTVGIEHLNQISQLQLYPNPMSKKSTLEVTLIEAADLQLQIFDLQGRIVRQQYLGELAAHNHKIDIQRGDLVAGEYVVVLQSKNGRASKKMLVKDF